MRILAVTATMDFDKLDFFYQSTKRGNVNSDFYHNGRENVGLKEAYQKLYWSNMVANSAPDVIVFMHDDVEVFADAWGETIEWMFNSDPQLAIVGLGGATGIGTPDIYKTPYHITQLQRTNYASNQRDWAVHGAHETGIRDVAVVDGFFMAVRTRFLDEVNGWKWFPHSFHGYDVGLCLLAIRRGWKIKMIGLDCHHHGGGTSTKPEYEKWCRERGTDMAKEHSEPHLFLYNEFADLLPYQVPK